MTNTENILNRVNVDHCHSVRRIVEGIIVRASCSANEAIAETASALGISEDAVRLAIAITNEKGA